MNLDFSNPMDLITAVAAFAVVLGVWFGLLMLRRLRRQSHEKALESRLTSSATDLTKPREIRLWHEGREVSTIVPTERVRPSLGRVLERLREEADYQLPITSILLGLFGASLLASVTVFAVTESLVASAGAVILALTLFWTYTRHRIAKRLSLFETQLVDALELASRSLRAGHPLVGAFKLISEEIPPPISKVFAEIHQQQSLGMSLEEALRDVAETSDNADLKLFVTSIVIQLKSGGNLADMMDRLAFVIRDRIRLNRRARVLTAQTQLSKRILIALPIILFVVLSVMHPNYMTPLLSTTSGRILLAIAGTGVLLGAWIMNRLSILRF